MAVVVIAAVLALLAIVVLTRRAPTRARGPWQRPPRERSVRAREPEPEPELGPQLPYADLSGPPEHADGAPRPAPMPERALEAQPAPPAVEAQGPKQTAAPAPPSPRPTRRAGVGRILLVDPDPASRSAAMRLLADAGYEVVHADDAGQGLDVYLTVAARPDVVIAPAFPPGLPGTALAEQLRAVDPELPVLLLSPYGPDAVHAPPGVRILSLPVEAEVLLAAVAEGLARA